MPRSQNVLEMREYAPNLPGLVEELDDKRQVEAQIDQIRGVQLTRSSEARDATEHRDPPDFLLVMQPREQLLHEMLAFAAIDAHHDHIAVFHTCLPSITPIQVALTHNTRLPLMFATALTHAPCSIRLKVSMENDENVVKPPRTPMSIPARRTLLSLSRSMNSTNRNTTARQPSTLTVRVP